jgi:multiple sugar transport system substrate-binding protein
MSLAGSWGLSALNAQKGLNYGIVPIPTPNAGDTVRVPTGGETFAVSRSASSAQQKAALAFLNWLITPKEDAQVSIQTGGVIPTIKAAVPQVLAHADSGAQMQPFVTELENGGTERTEYTGTSFSTVATTVGNAIDAAILGQKTAQQAFSSIAEAVRSEQQKG